MNYLSQSEIPLGGTNLIEAGAGTGKTFTLSSIYLRLLAETNLRVSNLLVVTFTEAATKELASRIRERLREACHTLASGEVGDEWVDTLGHLDPETIGASQSRFARAISEFDDSAIFTIHGFCKRMLEEYAFESTVPFDAELVKDVAPLRREIVYDFFAQRVYQAPHIIARYFFSRNIHPESLLRLVEVAMMGFDTEIRSIDVDENDVVNGFREAFDRARVCWQKDRVEIEDLLLGQDDLKGNSFNKKKMPDWFEEVNSFLASPDRASPLVLDSKRRPAVARLTTERMVAGTKKRRVPPRHPFFDCCNDLVEASEQFDRLLVAFKRDLIEATRSALADRKRKERIWSFDDLLSFTRDALGGPDGRRLQGAIANRFKAVLIDEFQDTDPLQYDIFSALFGKKETPLFFIGDPKQAIYGFRGANIHTYLKAASSSSSSRCVLDTNWRSEPGLIFAINALFGYPNDPFLSKEIQYSEVVPRPGAKNTVDGNGEFPSESFQIRFIGRLENRLDSHARYISKAWAKAHMPAFVANDIARLIGCGAELNGSPVGPQDIAVLTRTNEQAEDMQATLGSMGIPAVVLGSASVYQSVEAKELLTLLSAVLTPRRKGLVRAALVTQLLGFTADSLHSIETSESRFDRIQFAFSDWRHIWFRKGIVPFLERVLCHCLEDVRGRVGDEILALQGGSRRLSNVRHLVELLNTEETKASLSPWELVRWFASKIDRGDPEADDDKLRLETDTDAVRVITIHKSKGLEFNAVFCPYLWERPFVNSSSNVAVFHDAQNKQRRTLDLGTRELPLRKEQAAVEAFQEQLRLLYVALTRAKCLNVIYWGALSDTGKSALGYLFHQNGPAMTPREVTKRLSTLNDDRMQEDLHRLVERASPGSVSVTPVESIGSSHRGATPTVKLYQSARSFTGTIPRGTELYSFSGLVRSGTHEERISNDPESLAVRTPSESGRATIGLDEFEPGARAGNCIHAIFENLDFTLRGKTDIEGIVSRELSRARFDVEKWRGPVSQMTRDVLTTRFSSNPKLRLSDISDGKRWNELAFLFPISSVTETRRQLSALGLAERMSEHAVGAVVSDYANRLRELDFTFETGFVKGFMDLVFEWEGRYYLVDYKSNYLGPYPEDYNGAMLSRAMAKHDYILQYHLYVVALHRYLQSRIRNYDYDIHFGEVAYLFVRGMNPNTGKDLGVFTDRPPKDLVLRLSGFFGNARANGEGEHASN